MKTKKQLTKKQQDAINPKTRTGKIPNNVGFPRGMQGVHLNRETGEYEITGGKKQ